MAINIFLVEVLNLAISQNKQEDVRFWLLQSPLNKKLTSLKPLMKPGSFLCCIW